MAPGFLVGGQVHVVLTKDAVWTSVLDSLQRLIAGMSSVQVDLAVNFRPPVRRHCEWTNQGPWW